MMQRPTHIRFERLVLATVAALTIAACSGTESTSPANDPAAGLSRTRAQDTSSRPADTTASPGAATGPGYFQGVVVGYTPGAGVDTLSSSVKLPGVVVTAYHQGADGKPAGAPVASTTSDAQGHWQLSELAAGSYAVTLVPPTTEPYVGVWAIAYASPTSGASSWWTMLAHR